MENGKEEVDFLIQETTNEVEDQLGFFLTNPDEIAEIWDQTDSISPEDLQALADEDVFFSLD
jgi:hypothetical protein